MSRQMDGLIEAWDGIGVVVRHDAATGSWIFVALHDDTLGRPVGGCRMSRYDAPADGLRDAMRLARGMTHKWASIDMAFGGGKSVLAVPREMRGDERDGLLRRFGELLESLHGAYATGEDLGTTPRDMAVIAGATRWVMGAHGGEEPVDPGPYTALGVLAGMEAAVEHAFGDGGLEGRSVLIQGVGDVGAPLARMVAEAGGELIVSDLDEARVRELNQELGGRKVPPDQVYSTPCDVFAPCAVGAVLNEGTIPSLECRVVAGSANNQLQEPADAERLRERGVLYAPDYVINAGGAMAFGLMHQGITDPGALRERVRGLGDALRGIFREAEARHETPLAGARRKVETSLANAGQGTGTK